MADNEMFSGQESFLSSFTKSTTKFSAAIATFVSGVDSFNKGNFQFMDTLETWGKTFTATAFISSIEKTISRYNDARLDLARSFGIIGKERQKFMGILQTEREDFREYGVTIETSIESLKGLQSVIGSLDYIENQKSLIGTTNILSKTFSDSAEASGQLVGQMALLQGVQGEQIKGIFTTLAASADAAGISTKAVYENIKAAGHQMYLYNLQSEEGERAFNEMALMSTALGLNIGNMGDALYQYRNAGEAVAASTQLSIAGLQVSPRQLMSAAFEGNSLRALLPAFSQMQGMDKNRQIFAANALGQALGMSRDEVMLSFKRAQKFEGGIDALINASEEQLKEYAEGNIGFSERLDSLIGVITDQIADPLAKHLFPVLETGFEFIGKHLKEVVILLGVIAGANQALRGFNFLKTGAEGAGIGAAIKGRLGGILGGTEPGPAAGAMGKMPAAGAMGKMPAGGQSLFGKITGKGMIQGAAAMVIMAGAVWALGAALKTWEGIKWDSVLQASIIVPVLAGTMAGLGAMISTPMGALLMAGGAAALAVMGVALTSIGWGLGNFAKGVQPLLGHGTDLLLLGPALMGIFAAMAAFPFAGLGAAIGGLFGSSFVKPLNKLGEWAIKYADPLAQTAESVNKIASGVESISNSQKILTAITGSDGKDSSVNVNLTVLLNGKKLVEGMSYTVEGTK